MPNINPRIPVIGSGFVAWQRYQLREEQRRAEQEKTKLAAQLDDLLVVLGRHAAQNGSSELQGEIDALSAGRDRHGDVQKQGLKAEAWATAAQQTLAQLTPRRSRLAGQIAHAQGEGHRYSGRTDPEAAEARVRIEGERERLSQELARLDQEIAHARRDAEAAATEVRRLQVEWNDGSVEHDALLELGRRALEENLRLDADLEDRVHQANARLVEIEAEGQRPTEQLEALSDDVSIIADLSALAVTGLALLGLVLGLGRFEPTMIFSALIGGVTVWAVPGERWWWGPVRIAVSTVVYFWVAATLSGAYRQLELPVGTMVSLFILSAALVGLVVLTWRRAFSVSRIASVISVLLVAAAGWGVFNSHRDRVAMAEADEAFEVERIAGIRENPEPTLTAIEQAIRAERVSAAGSHIADLTDALGVEDRRVVDALERNVQLRQRLQAARARERQREEAERERRRQLNRRCGPHPMARLAARTVMTEHAHDPGSVEVVSCTEPRLNAVSCWSWNCRVRARNGFGARVLQNHRFTQDARFTRVLDL